MGKAAQSQVRNAAARLLQTTFRGHRMRRVAKQRWAALRTLQAHARGHAARLCVKEMRRQRAGRIIATACCTMLARQKLHCKRMVQMRRCRVQYLANRAHVVRLQAWWRSSVKRRRFRTLPKDPRCSEGLAWPCRT